MGVPFDVRQELPFHTKRDNKRQQPVDGLRPESRLYGGGTLPPGYEHLESLRRHARRLHDPSPSAQFLAQHFSRLDAAATTAVAAWAPSS